MAQLSDDCFAFGGALTPAAEALAQLESVVHPIAETETVDLRAANGRILAETVISERAVPPHDNAAVDGYAVFFDDLDAAGDTRLPCTGRAAAGHPLGRPAVRGEAIRVFTGAPMPSGPDTVLMQEDCRADGDAVIVPPGIKRGANWRSAGEDIAPGTTILTAGRALRPQDIGLAASVGRTGLAVFRRLRVAIFSTGDEVYEPGAALGAGGIYDSNRYVIAGLAERLGCAVTDMGILPDSLGVITDALAARSHDHDLLLTSGGMSTGDEDHVKAAVEALGHLHFWRLAIRPGRPIALGQVGRVPLHRASRQPGCRHGHVPAIRAPVDPAPRWLHRGGACTLSGGSGFRLPEEEGAARMAARPSVHTAGRHSRGGKIRPRRCRNSHVGGLRRRPDRAAGRPHHAQRGHDGRLSSVQRDVPMTLLYFAWVREQIGRDAEEIALPADVRTVAALLDWLRSRGGGYASALDDLSVIRVAVNQEFAAPDHAVADGDEIALFPPVTGGAPS